MSAKSKFDSIVKSIEKVSGNIDPIVIEFIKYQLMRIFLNCKKCLWSVKMKNFCTVFITEVLQLIVL